MTNIKSSGKIRRVILPYALVTLALTYAADAADRTSVFIRPIRHDSYLIRNVRICTYIIHRARKFRSQAIKLHPDFYSMCILQFHGKLVVTI